MFRVCSERSCGGLMDVVDGVAFTWTKRFRANWQADCRGKTNLRVIEPEVESGEIAEDVQERGDALLN